MNAPHRGRPSKYAEFDELVASLPALMGKRPKYVRGIGVFRGSRDTTAWLKIRLPHGGLLKGKSYPPNASVEMKVGNLASWTWEQLTEKHCRRITWGKADRGDPLEEAPDLIFSTFAETWLERAEKRASAVATERIAVRKHLVPEFGPARHIKRVSASDVNRWIAKRMRVAKPSTVQREFNTLRAILNDAVRSGLIEKSPTQNADPIRGAVARQRFLTNEELVALLAVAEKQADWLADFILWAVHSGMRKGEMQALTWSDIRELTADRVLVDVKHSKSGQPRFVVATRTMRDISWRARRAVGSMATGGCSPFRR